MYKLSEPVETIENDGMTYNIYPYFKEYGAPKVPDGFFEQLVGKPYLEQARYFVYTSSAVTHRVYAGGDESADRSFGGVLPEGSSVLDQGIRHFIVDFDRGGVIVGVMENDAWPFMAGDYTVEEDEDNNGAGYKVTTWYTYLSCIMPRVD